jgi:hypothetical protein
VEKVATCWWCGAVANSREHKFKVSELRASHGSTWVGNSAVIHGTVDEGEQIVRGPKADELKWAPSMCQDCNNRRSQPFDLAYDRLLAFLQLNERSILTSRKLSFIEIFGSDWRVGRRNLVKYWVKHICCRAAEINLPVPKTIGDFLTADTDEPPPHIRMAASVNQAMIDAVGEDALRIGSYFSGAIGWTDRATHQLIGFDAAVGWGWFRIDYEYRVTDPAGETTLSGASAAL